jgi:tetratricopeptide (TPR) repeat protein
MAIVLRALVAVLGLVIGTSAFAAEAADEIFMAQGVVEKVDSTARFISFELYGASGRYAADRAKVANADDFLAALNASTNTSRSIMVRYYAATGTILPDDRVPTFIVASIQYEGRTIAGEPALDAMPASARLRPDARLAHAIALQDGGRHADARAMLDVLLRGEDLLPLHRGVALRTRANANSDDAMYNHRAGAERDRLLIASLNDALALKQLDGGGPAGDSLAASALQNLGAHAEAIASYRARLERKPEDTYWMLLMIGVSHRAQGQYQQALAAYDEIVSRLGPQEGMAFHYHRGWTLLEMGRLPEAVDEFTAGLKNQPDYPGAFMRRACALAKLGRLREALSDQEAVVAGIREWGVAAPTAATKALLERSTVVVAELRAAVARNQQGPMDAPCIDGWNSDPPRERSPLLPRTATPKGAKD